MLLGMAAGVRHVKQKTPLCDKHDTILIVAITTCERQLQERAKKNDSR